MFHSKHHSFGPVNGYELGIAPFGKPVKTVFVYQVGSTVIDTGPHHLRKMVHSLINRDKVSHILLTHHHEDHSGNAALLEKTCGVPVFIHPYGKKKLASGFPVMAYQHLLFGQAPPLHADLCSDTIETERYTFKAIHTPGHSKDHIVFYEKNEGWLFSGDLFLGIKIRFFRVDEQIEEQIQSLKKVADLDFDTLFCGHTPCLKGGKRKIMAKLDFLQNFHQRVKELHHQGKREREIIRVLKMKNDLPVKLLTMGNASFSHMVRSSLRSHQHVSS